MRVNEIAACAATRFVPCPNEIALHSSAVFFNSASLLPDELVSNIKNYTGFCAV